MPVTGLPVFRGQRVDSQPVLDREFRQPVWAQTLGSTDQRMGWMGSVGVSGSCFLARQQRSSQPMKSSRV